MAVGTSVGGDLSVVALGCDSDTRFRAASITKPFTAFLAGQLLDLDDTAGVWPSDVRVRHLLSHMSGFDCELPDSDLSRLGDADGALAAAVEELPGVRRFVGSDEIWSYANTGYWLAGHLAAVRGGTSYEGALAERVLEPFGLVATSFGEPDLDGTGAFVVAGAYPRARRPSGGLVSTAADLVRFGQRLLAEPFFAEMCRPRGKPIGGVYGLGLFGERVGGADAWGHPGSYGGFQSQLLLVPDANAVFVGLTNAELGGKALYDVENAFFDEVLGARRVLPPFVELADEQLAAYAGRYENSDATADIRAENNGLVLAVAGEELFVRPLGDGRFRVPDGPHVRERIDFPRDGFVRLGSRLAARVA
ncbi:MAG TPA: serine hydrolase domain-containing protein [Gaiellaceae bacterium]|nr:serine hydrolase domain-containing protein [Gaiellaceae bacterium]